MLCLGDTGLECYEIKRKDLRKYMTGNHKSIIVSDHCKWVWAAEVAAELKRAVAGFAVIIPTAPADEAGRRLSAFHSYFKRWPLSCDVEAIDQAVAWQQIRSWFERRYRSSFLRSRYA